MDGQRSRFVILFQASFFQEAQDRLCRDQIRHGERGIEGGGAIVLFLQVRQGLTT